MFMATSLGLKMISHQLHLYCQAVFLQLTPKCRSNFLVYFGLLLPFYCNPLAHAEGSKDPWVEELLLQISELRKNDKDQRQQIEELRQELQALKAGAKQNAAGPLSIDVKNETHIAGRADAEFAIVEFSDYECPFCKRHAKQTIPLLKDKYIATGKLKYVYVDYPLPSHARAKSAAVAANCAGEEGMYWEMHDRLFENQNALNKLKYTEFAVELKLDTEKFARCLDNPQHAAKIDRNVAWGESLGVQGTPAFFIGRLKDGTVTQVKTISGALPFASFERVLDGMLSDTKQPRVN